jgi:molecular chaperone GrpE (heat shock protein)
LDKIVDIEYKSIVEKHLHEIEVLKHKVANLEDRLDSQRGQTERAQAELIKCKNRLKEYKNGTHSKV